MLPKMGWGVVLCGALLLVACGGGAAGAAGKPASGSGASSAPPQRITIKGLDTMRFDPATISVKAGAPVQLTLDDTGTVLAHDFTVDNLDGKKVYFKAVPNSRANGEFTPTAAGTYQFYCAEPGHKEAGMVGTLTVTS
jgi:uncharacterized cupredoxin-like copper-binding protein